jgi:hypothetical protein
MKARLLVGYVACGYLIAAAVIPAACSSKGGDAASVGGPGNASAATQLSVATEPSATAVNASAFTVQPAVQLLNASGSPVAQSGVVVTAALASGAGTLGGATAATTNASGVATFTNLAVTGTIGAHTLMFSSGSLTAATSASILLGSGVATQLSITTQPSAAIISAIAFTQQPVVQLADVSGNVVAQANILVTAVLTSGTGALGGTLTATTGTGGAATFSGLMVTGAAGNFTLGFSAPGVTSATSAVIAIAPPTLPSLAGTWSGTWLDTRYNVGGTITNVILTQSSSAFGGTGTIDLSSIALGSQSGTATGTISGSTVTFTFTSAGIGSGTGTLAANAGSGTGNITALNFGAFTFTGTATSTTISGTFQFTSPTGGNGTISVTKH